MAHQSFFKHDMETRVDVAKAKELAEQAAWRAVCKVVDERDGRQCRCCDKRSNPEATGLLVRGHRHHIIYRSAGGPDESWNLVTLCALCHDAEHVKCTLQIEGNADVALIFKRKDEHGEWFICREEIAVRQVRKD